jgi:hypothetical protein
MRAQLCRAVLHDDGTLNLTAARGLMLADVPVGRCGCGGGTYLDDVRPTRNRARYWLSLRCGTCHGESATPVPAASGLPATMAA